MTNLFRALDKLMDIKSQKIMERIDIKLSTIIIHKIIQVKSSYLFKLMKLISEENKSILR